MLKARIFAITYLISIDAMALDHNLKRETYNASNFNPTEIGIKKALIKSLYAYHWNIIEQTRYKIRASYKNNCIIQVLVDGAKVEFVEFKTDGCKSFSKNWISSLGNAYLNYIQIDYYVDESKKMIRKDEN